jgi:hypothetical protein
MIKFTEKWFQEFEKSTANQGNRRYRELKKQIGNPDPNLKTYEELKGSFIRNLESEIIAKDEQKITNNSNMKLEFTKISEALKWFQEFEKKVENVSNRRFRELQKLITDFDKELTTYDEVKQFIIGNAEYENLVEDLSNSQLMNIEGQLN